MPRKTRYTLRKPVIVGAILTVVILLGLGSRQFEDYLPELIADNAGDALWTIAVFHSLAIVLPKCSSWKLGVAAYSLSVAVEFSQLIDIDWLNTLRRTLPGRLLLGSDFLPVDLLRYFVGAAAATIIDFALTSTSAKKGPATD